MGGDRGRDLVYRGRRSARRRPCTPSISPDACARLRGRPAAWRFRTSTVKATCCSPRAVPAAHRRHRFQAANKERDQSWLDGSVAMDVSATEGRSSSTSRRPAAGRHCMASTCGRPMDRRRFGLARDHRPRSRLTASGRPHSCSALHRRSCCCPQEWASLARSNRGTLADYQAVAWFPDGRRLLLAAQRGRPRRQAVDAGHLGRGAETVSPERDSGSRPSAADFGGRTPGGALDQSRADLPPPVERDEDRADRGLDARNLRLAGMRTADRSTSFEIGELPAIVYRFHLADRRKEAMH